MILILREQIMCAIILVFLTLYYRSNKVRDKEMLFLNLTGFSLLHIVFDIMATITANNLEIVPNFINWLMHFCCYTSLAAVAMGFYNYILHTTMIKLPDIFRKLGYMPFPVCILLLFVRPVEYLQGSTMNYAYGPMMFWGYGIFMLYCIGSLFILLITRDALDNKVKRSLIPMVIAVIGIIVCQAFIPELSMTSGILTLICIAMFVASDNPDKDYKEQAQWDFLTGLKNRNCYNRDLENYIIARRRKKNRQIGFLVGDMNCLKVVNDRYGHSEGDKMLALTADILKENLQSAVNVYRVGGDEFVAIYLAAEDDVMRKEIESVKEACKKVTGTHYPLSIAIGYAIGDIDGDVDAIFKEADQLMYENKKIMKEQNHV